MTNAYTFLNHIAYNLRVSILEMTTQAGSGHPTSSLSSADLVAALFFNEMDFDPKDPYNPNNDRFILSKGHASPVLYAIWKELGILTEEDLMTYRNFNSVLEGHPTSRFLRTEAATGSLGQGLSIGVGMALNAKMDSLRYRTYVLMGDSECSEGSVWEAVQLASFHKLNNLIGILDCNRLGQSTQTMEGYNVEEWAKRFAAFEWQPFIINGHDMKEIITAFDQAKKVNDRPVIIIAKTIKGYGVHKAENKNGFHGKVFKKEELPEILAVLKERFSAYVNVPDHIMYPKMPEATKPKRKSTDHIKIATPVFELQELATRQAYGIALEAIGEQSEDIIVLDAEVKNSTYADIFEKKFPDRFVQCFIAEQNMVGMAVGFAARNKITFTSTFASFFSRAFDQIRMAAIGKLPLRLVGSHAGVSIGQDGPSQMGLEDIAMMRTLIDSVILYPSDAVSAYKLVEVMANHHTSISYLRTTRAATPIIYQSNEQFMIGGCKIVKQQKGDAACIVAAGITLFEALKAHDTLAKENIFVTVIDLYSIKPLDASTLLKAAREAGNIVITVEDHYKAGGIGEAVDDALKNTGITLYNLAVTKMPRSGTPEELLRYESINAQAIATAVKNALE